MLISGRSRGGDAHTHNLPLTGIYKGIFAQVLVYAWFYKSEDFCVYAKSSFCAYVHRLKSMESFINETPGPLREFNFSNVGAAKKSCS